MITNIEQISRARYRRRFLVEPGPRITTTFEAQGQRIFCSALHGDGGISLFVGAESDLLFSSAGGLRIAATQVNLRDVPGIRSMGIGPGLSGEGSVGALRSASSRKSALGHLEWLLEGAPMIQLPYLGSSGAFRGRFAIEFSNEKMFEAMEILDQLGITFPSLTLICMVICATAFSIIALPVLDNILTVGVACYLAPGPWNPACWALAIALLIGIGMYIKCVSNCLDWMKQGED